MKSITRKQLKYLTLFLFTFAVIGGALFYIYSPHKSAIMTDTSQLHRFTREELAQYDGSSTTLPIYIGLDGYVYDVTLGKKFYVPGAVYHYLAGNDSSKSLHIMGGETIKQKYPIIGILEK